MVTSPIVETDSWIWFLFSFMQTIPQKDFSWHDELIFSWYLFHKWNIIYVLHQRTGRASSKNQKKHKTLQPSLPQRNTLGSARSLGGFTGHLWPGEQVEERKSLFCGGISRAPNLLLLTASQTPLFRASPSILLLGCLRGDGPSQMGSWDP